MQAYAVEQQRILTCAECEVKAAIDWRRETPELSSQRQRLTHQTLNIRIDTVTEKRKELLLLPNHTQTHTHTQTPLSSSYCTLQPCAANTKPNIQHSAGQCEAMCRLMNRCGECLCT